MANPSSNSVNTPGKPIARIATDNGKVSVRLKNDTNATITYQAIGHQAPRALRNGEEIVLRDLPTPVTLTMVREDGGFIQVQPASANDSKTLDLLLNEAVNYDNSVGVLRIQNNGSVFTN